jgi:hypothetical protein
MTVWRQNRRQATTSVDPRTISERIRENERDTLESRLDVFLGGATPEEIRLLSAVMADWENRSHSCPHNYNEIYIAMAFEYQLDQPRCYIRVPERLVDQVEKYVDALRAIEDKAA